MKNEYHRGNITNNYCIIMLVLVSSEGYFKYGYKERRYMKTKEEEEWFCKDGINYISVEKSNKRVEQTLKDELEKELRFLDYLENSGDVFTDIDKRKDEIEKELGGLRNE
jgi:hypothetical protein